jgi:hypothetical protein
MSCESGGVKVDHAYSGPNWCPIVTSFVSKIGLSGSVASNVDRQLQCLRHLMDRNRADLGTERRKSSQCQTIRANAAGAPSSTSPL